MKSKPYKLIFMFIGVFALSLMIFKLGLQDILVNIKKTGGWFIPIIGSWLLVYMFNALAFRQIIQEPPFPESNLPFLTILRLTITGYAINYVTPFIALGGEPYRVFELKRFLGTHKATSSVLLYGITHVFSHIIFWVLSIFLIIAVVPLDQMLLTGCVVIFVLGVVIIIGFLRVYKKGIAVSTFSLLQKIPFFKKRAIHFVNEKSESLEEIDEQIKLLYIHRKSRFITALFYEITARIIACLEIYLIAIAIDLNLSLAEALIVSSASSLFANLIFFFPMQLGVREGGLALALKSIGLPAEAGIFIGIIMRIREIVWIVIGFVWIRLSIKRNN